MTEAQRKLLAWMADGDRAIYKSTHDDNRYGYHTPLGHRRLAARRSVEILVEKGWAEWMRDSPPDLRIMITEAGRRALENGR